MHAGEDDDEMRNDAGSALVSGGQYFLRPRGSEATQRAGGLRFSKYRRYRAVAYSHDSLCAISSWHGAPCACYHAWYCRPLSCRQNLRLSSRPSHADGLDWSRKHESEEVRVGL